MEWHLCYCSVWNETIEAWNCDCENYRFTSKQNNRSAWGCRPGEEVGRCVHCSGGAYAVGVIFSEGGEGKRLNNRTERGTYPSPAMRHCSILSRKEQPLHLMNGSARSRREQSYSLGAWKENDYFAAKWLGVMLLLNLLGWNFKPIVRHERYAVISPPPRFRTEWPLYLLRNENQA